MINHFLRLGDMSDIVRFHGIWLLWTIVIYYTIENSNWCSKPPTRSALNPMKSAISIPSRYINHAQFHGICWFICWFILFDYYTIDYLVPHVMSNQLIHHDLLYDWFICWFSRLSQIFVAPVEPHGSQGCAVTRHPQRCRGVATVAEVVERRLGTID